jgi:hypothetical protein
VSKSKQQKVKKIDQKEKKVVKKFKTCQVAPCIMGHFMCHGKPLKEKINKGGGGVGK